MRRGNKIRREEARIAEEEKGMKSLEEDSNENEDAINLKTFIKIGDEAYQKGGSCLVSILNGLRLGLRGVFNFLKDPWNFIDVANIIILIISIIVWIIFIAEHAALSTDNMEYFRNVQHNGNVEDATSLLKLYQRIVSLNLILISFKVLKYLGIMIERVTVMFKVINHAQSDIFYFFVLYVIIFISFTTTFHIFYGSQIKRFSAYGDSFNTLFLYLGRNILQIEEMKEMSFNFTVVYFIIFITLMDFILMNMFIAIIALSYSTVNKQMKEKNLEKFLEHTHWSISLYEYYKTLKMKIK